VTTERTASSGPPAGARLLRLYPAPWRARYEPEVLALLEEVRLDGRGRLDLVRGALDARLHGSLRIPAVAALLAGGLWTVAGTTLAGQPPPPDWPGYTIDVLPLTIVAVFAAIPALVGCWAHRSDSTGRLGALAIQVAVLGQLLWAVALLVAILGGGYGWQTAAAQAIGVLGVVLVGFASLRVGENQMGGLLVVAPSLMLVAWVASWLVFGLAWTLIGVVLLTRRGPIDPPLAVGP
jgi:hypothetical protein